MPRHIEDSMSSPPPPSVAELLTEFTLLIDGNPTTTASTLDVINPASGRVFARCPAASRHELDQAVAAARRAFPGWRARSYAERAERIGRLCQSLREHQDELARLLTLEQGKPLQQAKDEIARAASQSEGMTKIPIVPQVLE